MGGPKASSPKSAMYTQDILQAVRVARRTPVFTLVVIGTLALVAGVTTAVFMMFDSVLLKQLPYTEPDRLVSLGERIGLSNGRQYRGIAPADMSSYASVDVIEELAVAVLQPMDVTGNGLPQRVLGEAVTTSFFPTLGVKPVLGRVFVAEESRPGNERVVVVSYEYWQARFRGESTALGQAIVINGVSYVIVGVLPPGFKVPDQFGVVERIDVFLPAAFSREELSSHGLYMPGWFARLRRGVSLDQARSALKARAVAIRASLGSPLPLEQFEVVSLKSDLTKNIRPSLMILFGMVVLVLFLAFANLANLFIARLAVRQREFAVRLSLGAQWSHLVRQLLLEASLLAIPGCAVGLALGLALNRFLVSLSPPGFPRVDQASLDLRLCGFTALLFTIAVGALASVPTWQMSCWSRAGAQLASNAQSAGRSMLKWRSILVACQICLSVIALTTSGLLVRSLWLLNTVDLGFSSDNVSVTSIRLTKNRYPSQESRLRFFKALEERIGQLPQVQGVAFAFRFPFRGGSWTGPFETPEQTIADVRNTRQIAEMQIVSDGYMHLLGIPLLTGRTFHSSDRSGSAPVAMINTSMAKWMFGARQAVGEQIRPYGAAQSWRTIVGVVGGFRPQSREKDIPPQIFVPAAQTEAYSLPLTDFAVRSMVDTAQITEMIRREVMSVDPVQPIGRVQLLDEIVAGPLSERRFFALLLALFAGVALVLAAGGVYGLVAYSVAQRRLELGIRIALGGQIFVVVTALLGRIAVLIGASLLAGVVCATIITHLISRLLFGVSPLDPVTYAAVTLILGFTAVVSCLQPTFRAIRINPLVLLRHE